MKVSEWLGEDNKLGADIMQNKYLFTDENGTESFDEWLDRISKGDKELNCYVYGPEGVYGVDE